MQYTKSNILKSQQRRGAMIIMVLISMAILVMVAVFSVDYVYMQLIRTELRSALDLSAKAGTAAIQRNATTQEVLAEVLRVAAANQVGGRALLLDESQVILGRCSSNTDGKWGFSAGVQPYNSVRINATLNSQSRHGPVGLFFGRIYSMPTFEPHHQSTASFYLSNVALVLDRSHSMCFDNSGNNWVYPPNIPPPYESVKYPPDPTASRWAALMQAVNMFTEVCQTARIKPRVGLITWGSDIDANTPEAHITGETEVAVSRDVEFTEDYTQITNSLANRSQGVMLGGTNMSGGIDEGVRMLTGSTVSSGGGYIPAVSAGAERIMILMTDGQWNLGRDPMLAAAEAKAQNIVIHCIVYPSTTDPTMTQNIANLTGGSHYQADNPAELKAAFEKLALSIPVVLTD